MKYKGRMFWSAALVAVLLAAKLTLDLAGGDPAVVKRIDTTHKVVALTFDDGPHYKTTPELLRVLKEKHVRATLFILGANAAANPQLLAQAVSDGHEIATHAYSHRNLCKMSPGELNADLDQAEQAIMASAPRPTLFRPPGGAYNDAVIAQAHKRGYTVILWSVDPRDWRRPSVDQLVTNVLKNVKPGDIVLLHDGQYPLPTPRAVGQIIDRLRADGYTILTVGELLKYYEVREGAAL